MGRRIRSGSNVEIPPCQCFWCDGTAAKLLARMSQRIVPAKLAHSASIKEKTMTTTAVRLLACAAVAAMVGIDAGASTASAQDCRSRGQLDTLYCDDNG